MWCPGCILLTVCEQTYLIGSCIKLRTWRDVTWIGNVRISANFASVNRAGLYCRQGHHLHNIRCEILMTYFRWHLSAGHFMPVTEFSVLCVEMWFTDPLLVQKYHKLERGAVTGIANLLDPWHFSNYTHTGLMSVWESDWAVHIKKNFVH